MGITNCFLLLYPLLITYQKVSHNSKALKKDFVHIAQMWHVVGVFFILDNFFYFVPFFETFKILAILSTFSTTSCDILHDILLKLEKNIQKKILSGHLNYVLSESFLTSKLFILQTFLVSSKKK